MINTGPTPVEPRPASTVLLLRGAAPWEVLMMRRPGGSDFAPGAHVFPGGSLHSEDHAFEDPFKAAAIREMFEELGILLARGRRGFARAADCEQVRTRLEAGAGFNDALREAGLAAAFDRLAYFANVITPVLLSRRFDTRFYLARLPPGQHVHPHAGEVDGWLWVDPVKAAADLDFNMVFATRRVLAQVASESDAARLIARARRRRTIRAVTPVVRIGEDGKITVVVSN